VKGDGCGFFEEPFQGGFFYAVAAKAAFVLVVGENANARSRQAVSGLASVCSKPNDAHCERVEFVADKLASSPLPVSQVQGSGPDSAGK
jgi:hypothetical protein